MWYFYIFWYYILVIHCNGLLNSSFICVNRYWIFLSVRSSKTISQTFLSSLTNLKKVIFKDHWENSAICFSVLWESFSLELFLCFTLVVFNVVEVACREISCMIWYHLICRNCTKKPMNSPKETEWITVRHPSSRLMLLWRTLVM